MKIKPKYKLLIILLLIIIICYIPIYLEENHQKIKNQENQTKEIVNNNSKQTIEKILSYKLDEKITKEFLNWINEKYSETVLTKLKESIEKGNYQPNLWHKLTKKSFIVLLEEYNKVPQERTKIINLESQTDITLSFVGDISLADNWYIMPKYDEREKKVLGILSEKVVDIMNNSTLTIANNEFTISNRGEPLPNKLYTFRASPQRLKIYKEMGVDLVTLANNHIYDFGIDAFNDSLNTLEEQQIPYIGAGRNLEEAKQPYYFIINGYKIAFVNATRAEKFILTPEATTTTGGVLRCYDPTTFINIIQETKQNSDFVIALIHWGTEDTSQLEQVQIDTSKQYIEAGADIIIGTHAHTLQGIDFYEEKAIIYNLGDFIFNNETKDTGIFQLTITEDGSFKYKFFPCKEENEYTDLLTGAEQKRVLEKMQNLSPNITMEETGEFYKNK